MTSPTEPRRMTIAANGEIVPKPYGPSRWASPRRYACAHAGCDGKAAVTARSGAHDVERVARDGDVTTSDRAHNCCGEHS